jgi:DNA-directed RNA polymerase subunit RPC12/RpoP
VQSGFFSFGAMSITVSCFNCSRQFTAPEDSRGKTFRCPACGSGINVPPAVPTRATLGTGRVADLLRDDARPSTPPSITNSQAAAALGITQREMFASGAVPPPIPRKSKSRWRTQGGALGFILDHKLVLAVLAASAIMLMGSFLDWHNAAIGLFAFLGFGVAVGAWRSQWFANSEMKAAEDWRLQEMWIGGAMLLFLAGWGSYLLLAPVYLLFAAGMERGFTAVVSGMIAGFLLAWAALIGYCVGMGAMSRKHGFFKVAAWNYVVIPLVLAALALTLADQLKKLPDGVHNALGPAHQNEAGNAIEPIRRINRPPVHPRAADDEAAK